MIGYLGPEGSFTHQALFVYCTYKTKYSSKIISFKTISQIIENVSNGKIESGFIPMENSLEGSVGETLDGLLKTSQKVTINHEVIISIEHCLLTKAKKLSDIKTVLAHPQALGQCQSFIKRYLPEATIEAATSNSSAVQKVGTSNENTIAAIGPEMAGEIYKVPVFEKGINDEKENYTRFVLIGTDSPKPTGKDKSTIAFGVPFDKPGTLVEILQSFAKENINLTRIESRPSKKALGEYVFFIDIEAHKEDENLKRALSQIVTNFSFYRWLGSYPIWQTK